MIKRALGAAFIAGSTIAIYNTDSVGPVIDDAITEIGQQIDVPPAIEQNKEVLALGGGALGLLLGLSFIAGDARRRLKKEHGIHPDVDAAIDEKLSATVDAISEQLIDPLFQMKASNRETAGKLKELTQRMEQVDTRLAGELSVDISALEKASEEMDGVESTSARVLEILERIEKTADAYIEFNDPNNALENYKQAKTTYQNAFSTLERTVLNALGDGSFNYKRFPNRMTGMIGQAVDLNKTILSELAGDNSFETSMKNVSKQSQTMISAIKEDIKWFQDQTNNRSYMKAINQAAYALAKAADEYVVAHYAVTGPQRSQKVEAKAENNAQSAAANDDGFEPNEDGMIEVPGYGAISATPPATPDFG